ncbi:LysR family transcriptional regulator [Metabacillus iocasae]|uniref:DNA-binding transcriptional LysR family regulator n=1 Tax=Priestia iocasae TaxID=2291674 RepID=A0ABS2R0N4_9BACI|nr:LysR family transcriptional regulator [Metabacillus iocasae]MBM7705038.1 DNA-binding transcriptional LysR family regulator [Metabacillus iocasae]
MIDFEWYRSFISIYKHQSVSAAARARFLTQPAMSQHLAALEAEVGEVLFIRAPRKMIPTDKGKELYARIVPLIENLETMTLEITHAASPTILAPIIRLGSAGEYFTKRALSRVHDLEVRFSVQFGITSALIESLQNDQLDLAIATQKLHLPGIEYTKIEEETFVIVVPFDAEVNVGEHSVEEWLNEQRWISYGLELPIIRRIWKEHFQKRPKIRPYHVMSDLRTILEAIEYGMGMSILPTYLIQESLQQQKVKVIFPDLTFTNELYAAYKIEQKQNPIYQHIIKGLKQT